MNQSPRWLQRLDAAVAQAETPLARECAKADRAVRLARMGRLDDARFALTGLRTQQQRLRAPLLEARIALLTGMIAHFTTLSPQAKTHFIAAQHLAEEAGDGPLATLAAAWSAQCLLNEADLPALTAQLRYVLGRITAHEHSAWARLGLTLCVALENAGDLATSQRWGMLARQHASQDDDSSMMSAVLYNTSSLRASRIAMADAWGEADLDEARSALLEMESAGHYDFGAGSSGLGALVPMNRALLLSVLGRCDDAVPLFEQNMDGIRTQGHSDIAGKYMAEWAWCEARLGHTDRARRMALRAEQELKGCDNPDDPHTCAATFARLAQLMAHCGKAAEAADLRVRAEVARGQWQDWQQRMREAVDALALQAP